MLRLNEQIKFGTDGWRGVISDNFTFENVKRVAKAVADYYNREISFKSRTPKAAVGFDTRFLSDQYAGSLSEVLSENGIKVYLSDQPIPTPALSFAVKNRKLDFGIMITASHNPAEYNGIKIKTASGGAAGVDVTSEIEKFLAKPARLKAKFSPIKIIKTNFTAEYIKFLRSYVDLKKLKSARFRVLVDAMHGSGNTFMSEILKGTKIKLEFIRSDINPSFEGLRPEPVLENLGPTIKRIKQSKFDLGLVLDGDADRIAAFAGNGEFIYPQKVLGLLALHLVEDRKMKGGVVKTIVGTNLMDNLTKSLNLKLYETPVGFKYISELMQKKDIVVGGEEAGGMGFKNYIPERDGTLAGLLLLEMMVYRKKPMIKILKEMEGRFGRYYYARQDLKLKNIKFDIGTLKKLKSILGKKIIQIKDYDGIKLVRSDASWLMFRASGTEPIMRVYAESKSDAVSRRMVEFGSKLVKNVL